jgi:cytochrome c biogenesis protein CcmG/thiol:disulfide interchange protein DsbE
MSTAWKRGLLLSAVVAVVLSVAALLATGLGRDPAVVASPLVGRAAPAFELAGLDGPAVRLSDLRGQIVVVNFWASWCAECRTEQDALNQTWSRFRDSGVTVLGVNFQDTTPDAREYVGSLGIRYPVVQDTESSTALAYGLRGVPETFVVDRSGHIVDRVIGPVSAKRLADRINTLLQAGAR